MIRIYFYYYAQQIFDYYAISYSLNGLFWEMGVFFPYQNRQIQRTENRL